MGDPKKKILIVDDDPNVHIILKITLEKAGYEVFSAMDAMQGPMMVRQVKPDLIILDIMMPAGGGIAVYNRLKQTNMGFQIPVIIHSSTPKDQVRDKLPEVDSLTMVQKPAELTEFLKLVAAKIANPTA